VACSSDDSNSGVPTNGYPSAAPAQIYASVPTANKFMNPAMIGAAGGGQAHSNLQPYLTLNFCICLQGIFPARN
jgi:microcystin-dependent protein